MQGTGFQKAAQNPEQSNQADVYLAIKKNGHRGAAPTLQDANLCLTKKCGAGFHKAAQYQPDVTVFVQLMRRKGANLHLTKHLRLELSMRHKDANLHLTKKCGTGFQKAALCPPYLSSETSLHI